MSRWATRPTRRGVAVAAVAVVGGLLAARFGPRSLNAVVVPCLVALVAAVVQVRLRSRPPAERALPPDGFPGDTGTVRLRFDVDDPYPAVVEDRLSAGFAGDARAETLVGGEPTTYEVEYVGRGEQTVGPAVVRVRDVLGLVERQLVTRGRRSLLVYPPVRRLSHGVVTSLRSAFVTAEYPGRGEFDGLREYVRGDDLRDIHWKTSAKYDDLIIQEHARETDPSAVTMHARANGGDADAMATAAASVASALLGAGVPVVLVTPGGRIEAGPDERVRILEHLARAPAGSTADEEADVVVDARADGTHVRAGSMETTFEQLSREAA
jgi:uncharacterized protein (DUF58 family)